MYITVDESIYNMILSAYGEDYVTIDDGEFCVYYLELIDAGYAEEIDGSIYTKALKPSQKGIFIGKL